LMLALYRSGRQAEAIKAYRSARSRLVDELGMEPVPELRELERAILRHDDALRLPSAGPPAPRRAPVAFVALDVARGADLEVQRSARERAVEACRPLTARYGASLLGASGSVLLAFGAPAVHEDDGLRAVRAAFELRDALPDLEPRLGVEAGEVLLVPGQELDVVGEAPQRASALARRAGPGEILLGRDEIRLVAGTAVVEPAGADAWRVLQLAEPSLILPVPLDTPFVGRGGELARLRRLFDRVARETSALLATVVGEAGVGKTRLAIEFVGGLSGEAHVLSGRGVAYGEATAFRPLRELIESSPAGDASRAAIAAALDGDRDDDIVADRLASAVGEGGPPPAPEELAASVRRFLSVLARERPLVLVLEDLHAADRRFLELLDDLVRRSRFRVLVVCLARPELLELWPGWSRLGETIELSALDAADSETLISALAGDLHAAVRTRVLEAAEGNPFFLEQMVADLRETAREPGPSLPPTIRALLAARLDRLGPGERAVLERAAIIGRDFPSAGLADLLPEAARSTLERHLHALVRRGFLVVRPGTGERDGSYRFRHPLIQEAAYRSMTKALRAELHERFADWLDLVRGPRSVDDGLVAYHLERAVAYRRELDADEAETAALARRAGALLAAAGLHAAAASDVRSAASMLGRASSLLPRHDEQRMRVLPELASAMFFSGDLRGAERAASDALESAARAADPALETQARLARAGVQLLSDPQASGSGVQRELERLRDLADALEDERGVARALYFLAHVHWRSGRIELARVVIERQIATARRARDGHLAAAGLSLLTSAFAWGPTPVAEAIRRCREIHESAGGNAHVEATSLQNLAVLAAMLGRFDEARAAVERAWDTRDRLGQRLVSSAARSYYVERLAGSAPAAAEGVARAYAEAEELGSTYHAAQAAGDLAQIELERGDLPASERLVVRAEELVHRNDLLCQVTLCLVRGRLALAREDTLAARREGAEAVRRAARTDLLVLHGDAQLELARALRRAGRREAAVAATRGARDLYERKGNTVSAGTAAAFLAELSVRGAGILPDSRRPARPGG
ncbi:MAG: ATP-binding protein, partial [Gaiellaceae bacterium]